jgi:glycosyltransferase involved in cell wall biosynthesis
MDAIRILSIVWYKVLPAEYGGQKGIANFNQSLGKLFPLVCLCSKENEAPPGLSYTVLPELPVTKLQFLNPFIQQKIVGIAKREKPTHIILEHPYHAKAAINACKATGAKLIVHSHNIESERYRQLKKKGWQLLYKLEKRIHQLAALSLFKTENDRKYAIENFMLQPDKCIVMPYGVERPIRIKDAKTMISDRYGYGLSFQKKLLLFAGTLDYEPNLKAVFNIYEHLPPYLAPDQEIIICGRNRTRAEFFYLKNHSRNNVTYAGEVNDIATYFSAADIFVNPVMTGGGVQTKNLDALSYDLNIVCFDTMLSGLDLSFCRDKVFIARAGDWNDFAEKMNLAIKSPSPPITAGFFNHYSFDNQVAKLAKLL